MSSELKRSQRFEIRDNDLEATRAPNEMRFPVRHLLSSILGLGTRMDREGNGNGFLIPASHTLIRNENQEEQKWIYEITYQLITRK